MHSNISLDDIPNRSTICTYNCTELDAEARLQPVEPGMYAGEPNSDASPTRRHFYLGVVESLHVLRRVQGLGDVVSASYVPTLES